jgi:hypothetical protein
MDRLELKFYKELSLHERINDKQEQLEHLTKICAYDHGDIEGCEIFTQSFRKYLEYLVTPRAKKPY